MSSVQWGTPTITVEKVLDSNPNVHLMNLEDALRQKRYDEAVAHLKYAWTVANDNQEVKEQCLEVLKVLKKLGYAKDIHWDRENRLTMLISSIIVGIIVFAVCLFIWNIKVASIAAVAGMIAVICCFVAVYNNGNAIIQKMGIMVFYVISFLLWIVVADYACTKIWDAKVAETVVKVLVVIFIIGAIGVIFYKDEEKE